VPDPRVSPEKPGLNHVATLEIYLNALPMTLARGLEAGPIVEHFARDEPDERADQFLLLELLSRFITNKVVGWQLASRLLFKLSVNNSTYHELRTELNGSLDEFL
jgi:hypothetical protein